MNRLLIIISVLYFIPILCSCNKNDEILLNNNTTIEETKNDFCMVDIRGEVMYPGIYKIRCGSIISDVVELAGGITNNADINNVNLVLKIESNTKIYIPSKNDTSTEENNETSLININTATLDILMTIPYIGKSKAQSIIEYRNQNGNFKKIDDIKNVSGIGDALFNKIKTYICV